MASTFTTGQPDAESTAPSLEAADDWAFDAVEAAATDGMPITANPTNY